jgi:hypothetical protein
MEGEGSTSREYSKEKAPKIRAFNKISIENQAFS